MAAIVNLSIDVSKLPKEKFVKGKTGIWYNFTLKIQDESMYGNNGMVIDSQTKEENDAYKAMNKFDKKEYIKKIKLGNAQVVWTNGTINKVEKEEELVTNENTNQNEEESNDLPF
tara:strand:- start:26 stop:370 length:345 start_codon:yes stop_codon:yes gene_type:complete